MKLTTKHKRYLTGLHKQYLELKKGKDSLLEIIAESELPEMVYNSNAIENSTLTLPDTEKILLDQEVSRDLDLREVYEAKNLARLNKYMQDKAGSIDITLDLITTLHQMLIGVIDDSIAGRFRTKGEYVRVGYHIAPAPEHIESMLTSALEDYYHNQEPYFLSRLARFHLEFETIHPFNDGNGRVGRILLNWQLLRLGYPPIIIRNKGKEKYYDTFGPYRTNQDINGMQSIIYLLLAESLHKRLAYLSSDKIISLVDYAQNNKLLVPNVLNKALRQTIPAFREKGDWKIGVQT